MPQFDDILQLIEKSINRFNRRIPATQKDMLSAIEEDLRSLDVQNGNIKASVKNLSIIARIKNRMTKIILTDDYKQDVKEFAGSFNEVTALQNQYWRNVEAEYKPAPLLKEIKNITIEDTVNKLMDSGMNANIVDPISDILRTNITTGGSYRALTDQLKQSLTDTNTPGLLSKYAKTLTVDSLNTYNAQYTQTTSSDLGFEWYKYSNTDIETTRPFCDAMTDQPYFHVSEIPALLRAENLTYVNKKGERVPVPIYSKTGLPHGMKEGTNEANFLINRGGWNCGHQCRPVSASLVPDDVKSRVFATPAYIRFAAQKRIDIQNETPPPKASPPTASEVRKKIVENANVHLANLKKNNYDTHEDLFDYLPREIPIVYADHRSGAHFDPTTKKITISGKGREQSEYYKKFVLSHEIAHAIHDQNNLITNIHVDDRLTAMRDRMAKTISQQKGNINNELLKLGKTAYTQKDFSAQDQLTELADILGSLTKGAQGWGHTKAYYKQGNSAMMELFANGTSLLKNHNPLLEKMPKEFQDAIEDLKGTISDILKTVKQPG